MSKVKKIKSKSKKKKKKNKRVVGGQDKLQHSLVLSYIYAHEYLDIAASVPEIPHLQTVVDYRVVFYGLQVPKSRKAWF